MVALDETPIEQFTEDLQGLKVVHWGIWGMYQSGMSMTQVELIRYQRMLGLNCGMIDARDPELIHAHKGFKTHDQRWADDADIYCLHSHIPVNPGNWFNDETLKVCFLHGMPRYSWESEVYQLEPGNDAPMAQLTSYANMKEEFSHWLTMWPTQFATWEILDNYQGRVRAAPNGVCLETYRTDGPTASLAGKPTLLVCDQARMCKDPFVMVFGAEYYRQKFEHDARVHIVGFPPSGTGNRVRERWDQLISQSGIHRVVAGVSGIVKDLPRWYRGSDIMLTTITDESRVTKEAIASGVDVLAPTFSTELIDESWLDWAAPEVGLQTTYRYGPDATTPPAERDSIDLADHNRQHPFWQAINTEDTAQVAAAIDRIHQRRQEMGVEKRAALLRAFAEKRYDMKTTAAYCIEVYKEAMAQSGRLTHAQQRVEMNAAEPALGTLA